MQMERFSRQRWILCLKTAAVILTGVAICLLWSEVVAELAALVFGAAALAFILTPLCRLLEKKLKRPLAALISLVGAFALLLAALAILLPALFRQLSALAEGLPEAFSRLRTLTDGLAQRIESHMPGFRLPQINFSGAQGSIGDAARGAISTVSSAADGAYRLFLTVVLSYFLVADRENILLRLELMIPHAWRRGAVRAGNMLVRELRLYLRGQATIALAVGVVATAGLMFIGLNGAPLLGLFVGLFNIIPYFGPFLGGVPAVITALSVGWQKAALTVLILFLVQQIDGMLISPRVMGSITGFSPAVVMISLFVGARVGSIAGMLLAMPTLMAARTLYRVFVQRHENN